jgi:hypothetical protein
MKQRKLA